MAVPPFEDFYRPVLEITAGPEAPLTRKEVTVSVTERFSLTEAEQRETIPSGIKTRVRDRVDWALTDLKQAGLLGTPRHNQWQITSQGEVFLNDHPGEITRAEVRDLSKKLDLDSDAVLSGIDGLVELIPDDQIAQGYRQHIATVPIPSVTPDELIAQSHRQLQVTLSREIQDALKGLEPAAFERLVVKLLEEMGYGYGIVTGRSHDGGIDGILTKDRLGLLEKVCVQAKRYNDGHPVGMRDITQFVGSLDDQHTNQGVFITASSFASTVTKDSKSGIITMGSKSIHLIDGRKLAELMIRHGVGVVTEITYAVKKLDANYFAEV